MQVTVCKTGARTMGPYKVYGYKGRTDPLTDKEKARLRAAKGVKSAFSSSSTLDAEPAFKATREHLTVVRDDWVPPKLKGRSGTRLNPAIREMVKRKAAAREEFLRGLGVKV